VDYAKQYRTTQIAQYTTSLQRLTGIVIARMGG
jgi:hypothetical protein